MPWTSNVAWLCFFCCIALPGYYAAARRPIDRQSTGRGGSSNQGDAVRNETVSPDGVHESWSSRGVHGDRNCSGCTGQYTEETKRLRLEGIKAQILSKLGMTQPPNITKAQLARLPSLQTLMRTMDQPMNDQPAQPQHDSSGDDYDDDFMIKPQIVFSTSTTEGELENYSRFNVLKSVCICPRNKRRSLIYLRSLYELVD